jgi:peptidoglycan/LPS O-acetylase OafA/YrhL
MPNKAAYFALGIASMGGCGRYSVTLLAVLGLCWAQGGAEKLAAPLLWTLCLAAQHRPDLPGLRGVAAILRARVAQWFGALSYCLYLANEPIQKCIGVPLAWAVRKDASLFTMIWIPAAIILPVGLALIVHRLLERPAMRWSRAEGR